MSSNVRKLFPKHVAVVKPEVATCLNYTQQVEAVAFVNHRQLKPRHVAVVKPEVATCLNHTQQVQSVAYVPQIG